MANALLITVPTDTLNDTLRGVSKVIDEMLSDLLAFLSDLVAVSSVCFFEGKVSVNSCPTTMIN